MLPFPIPVYGYYIYAYIHPKFIFVNLIVVSAIAAQFSHILPSSWPICQYFIPPHTVYVCMCVHARVRNTV